MRRSLKRGPKPKSLGSKPAFEGSDATTRSVLRRHGAAWGLRADCGTLEPELAGLRRRGVGSLRRCPPRLSQGPQTEDISEFRLFEARNRPQARDGQELLRRPAAETVGDFLYLLFATLCPILQYHDANYDVLCTAFRLSVQYTVYRFASLRVLRAQLCPWKAGAKHASNQGLHGGGGLLNGFGACSLQTADAPQGD